MSRKAKFAAGLGLGVFSIILKICFPDRDLAVQIAIWTLDRGRDNPGRKLPILPRKLVLEGLAASRGTARSDYRQLLALHAVSHARSRNPDEFSRGVGISLCLSSDGIMTTLQRPWSVSSRERPASRRAPLLRLMGRSEPRAPIAEIVCNRRGPSTPACKGGTPALRMTPLGMPD